MFDVPLWASRWGVPAHAVAELLDGLHADSVPQNTPAPGGMGEAAVQQRICLKAAKNRMYLWRNNRGACTDKTGRVIRYGLANDSSAIDERVKSSDLIGITPHLVTPEDVGQTLGIFTSIEVKRGDWRFKGTGREEAQKRWLDIVNINGGIGVFANHEGIIDAIKSKY